MFSFQKQAMGVEEKTMIFVFKEIRALFKCSVNLCVTRGLVQYITKRSTPKVFYRTLALQRPYAAISQGCAKCHLKFFIIPAHLVVHGLFSHHVILSRFPFHWDYVEMSETKFQISSPCIQIINNNNWFSLVLLPVPFLLVGMFIEDIK